LLTEGLFPREAPSVLFYRVGAGFGKLWSYIRVVCGRLGKLQFFQLFHVRLKN